MTRYNAYLNKLNRLKRVENLHHHKAKPMFSEASQKEWHEPFYFSTTWFPLQMVSTLGRLRTFPTCPFMFSKWVL